MITKTDIKHRYIFLQRKYRQIGKLLEHLPTKPLKRQSADLALLIKEYKFILEIKEKKA